MRGLVGFGAYRAHRALDAMIVVGLFVLEELKIGMVPLSLGSNRTVMHSVRQYFHHQHPQRKNRLTR